MEQEFNEIQEIAPEEVLHPSTEDEAEALYTEEPSLMDVLPKETTDELCSLFSCSPEALDVILKSTSGDPDKLLALVRTLSPEYVAIKMRFDARKRGELDGALCFLARGATGELLDDSFWVSTRSLPDTFDLSASWESVRSTISTMSGNPDRSLFSRMLKASKSILTPTAINKLFKAEGPAAKEDIISAFEKSFGGIVHYDMVYDLRTEIFNKARLSAAGILKEENQTDQGAAEEVAEQNPMPSIANVQVICKPILDPVKGKAVSDLVRGDLVMVELEKRDGIAGIITKILDSSGELPIFPVLSVEKLPSGQTLVKIHISDGIEGVLKTGADLKLKIGDRAASEIRRKGAPFSPGKMFAATAVFLGVAVLFYLFFR